MFGAEWWHTDATAMPEPPRAASLRAIKLPPAGGDTLWASMYAAYEALSSKMQRFLGGLEALHSTDHHPAARQGMFSEPASAVHPVVIGDPVTGKPFDHSVEGATAHIRGGSIRGEKTDLESNVQYELTLQK